MRVMITGCNGLAGQRLVQRYADRGEEILGVDLAGESWLEGTPGFTYRPLDIRDGGAVREAISGWNPEAIVNCAAMTNVDGCERDPEACFDINTYAVGHLAASAAEAGAHLVQISTDYVFDGRSGPYRETDRTNPLSAYGRSKRESERILLNTDGLRWAVARTVVLWGHGHELKASFVQWLLGELEAGRPVKIVSDQVSNTTEVAELVQAVEVIVDRGKTGLFHAAGRGVMSRFDFALKVAEVFGLDPSLISPIETAAFNQPAPRPLRSGLLLQRTEERLGLQFATPDEMLARYKAEREAG